MARPRARLKIDDSPHRDLSVGW